MPYLNIHELPDKVKACFDEVDAQIWLEKYNEAWEKAPSEMDEEDKVYYAQKEAWMGTRDLPSAFSVVEWATVEDIDKDNEVVTLDKVQEHLDKYIEYGGAMQDTHSNLPLGHVWHAERRKHPESGKDGIVVWYNLRGGTYETDKGRQDWLNGKNFLSIGASATVDGMECNGTRCYTKRGVRDLYEISLCEVPANPHASVIEAFEGRVNKANGEGTCFKESFHYVERNPNMFLVHGIITVPYGPLEGMSFSHAWVEDGDTVHEISNGNNVRMPRNEYYELQNITQYERYNWTEAREHAVKTRHYGPWNRSLLKMKAKEQNSCGCGINKYNLEDIPAENRGGNCYEASFHLLLENQDMTLVHGIVTGRGAIAGIEFGHAWCERDGLCYDYANNRPKIIPQEIYYDAGKITTTRKYSYREALAEALRTEHYGPWDSSVNKCSKEPLVLKTLEREVFLDAEHCTVQKVCKILRDVKTPHETTVKEQHVIVKTAEASEEKLIEEMDELGLVYYYDLDNSAFIVKHKADTYHRYRFECLCKDMVDINWKLTKNMTEEMFSNLFNYDMIKKVGEDWELKRPSEVEPTKKTEGAMTGDSAGAVNPIYGRIDYKSIQQFMSNKKKKTEG